MYSDKANSLSLIERGTVAEVKIEVNFALYSGQALRGNCRGWILIVFFLLRKVFGGTKHSERIPEALETHHVRNTWACTNKEESILQVMRYTPTYFDDSITKGYTAAHQERSLASSFQAKQEKALFLQVTGERARKKTPHRGKPTLEPKLSWSLS